MPLFFPPPAEVPSAGESHLLDDLEVQYMQMTGTLMWDAFRDGYILAPGKTWSDYVRDMNVIEPPDEPGPESFDNWVDQDEWDRKPDSVY